MHLKARDNPGEKAVHTARDYSWKRASRVFFICHSFDLNQQTSVRVVRGVPRTRNIVVRTSRSPVPLSTCIKVFDAYTTAPV